MYYNIVVEFKKGGNKMTSEGKTSIIVQVDEKLKEKLENNAKQLGITKSAYLRLLIMNDKMLKIQKK